MGSVGSARAAASSRIDELRRVVTGTADAAIRARLRVELSDLLRSRDDTSGALAELRLAAAEAPRLPSVRLALLSAAGQMPVSKRARFLAKLVEDGAQAEGDPVPVFGDAAASARAESGAVDDAISAWLAVANDARVPMYRRRAAARRAAHVAGDRSPVQLLAALRLHAGLTTGRTRLALLRRAIGIARGGKDRTALMGLASDWLDIGGAPASAAALVKQAWAAGAPAAEVARLEAEIARRLGRRPPAPTLRSLRAALDPAGNGAAAEIRRPAARAARRDAAALLEEALQAARAGHSGRARRLAERALRSGGEGRRYGGGDGASDASLAPRLGAVDAALRQGGALREALLLRRTQLEGEPEATRPRALIALAADAAAAGLDRLARIWRADVSLAMPPPRPTALPEPVTPADHFLAAQRLLARLPIDAPVEPVLALLAGAVAGHAAADEALALGEKLIARSLSASATVGAADSPARVDPRFVDLLRAASVAETEIVRRARIAERLADALERLHDPIGSIAVLARVLETLPPDVGATLRLRRTRLLRQLGRLRELGDALDRDVLALTGPPRLAAYTERAALLDGAGEPERALEVRLQALADHPAELPLLHAARRRLESTGRPDQSLRLAVAAVEHVTAPAERRALLRDIAVLSEKAARNLTDAATAWMAVLEIDPDDVSAADAAERLLVASGQTDRCADLLAWAAARATGGDPAASTSGDKARPDDPARRAALLWRLAELRRGRLGQEDEALRLYIELGRLSGQAAATPAALDPVPGRRSGKALALHTARAAVAPTAVDQARALLDRGLYLLDHAGKTGLADAERDLMRALDLDPRNVDVVIALERLTERNGRWAELGDTFRHKALEVIPAAAARLWYGAGRASERMANLQAAGAAYQQAVALDPALRQPVSALARLAHARGEWDEAARLLEIEIGLCVMPGDKARVAAELGAIVGEHLRQPARALELLEPAATLFPDDAVTLERLFRFNLAVGGARWEQAGQVLERWIASGAVLADAADKYYTVGAAAEADGRPDRALAFYSRAYGRNNSHRPALERLSEICFERDQWENAWKATEALLERHRPVLSRAVIAELLLRSALCDVHLAQRSSAHARMAELVNEGVRFASDGGVRDVAESWGAMRLEPRLLVGLEGERRARALRRAADALAMIDGDAGPVRAGARQLLGAIAMVDRRWADALGFLEALAADESCDAHERGAFLIAAGDIRQREGRDPDGAQGLYERARVLIPNDVRLNTRLEQSLDAEIDVAAVVEPDQG